MAAIKIPKRDLLILKRLTEYDNGQFGSLVSAFGDTKPTLTRSQFLHDISEKVASNLASEIKDVLRVVFVLYSLKERSGITSKELARDICESAYASKDVQFPPEKKELFLNRLNELLVFDQTIAVTAKAFDVMTEHEHVFCSARILSDIRPVFTSSVESASAGVISHNLQIGYHDGGSGEHKEIYVVLDTNDIQTLKEILVRAEKKTVALQSILKNSNIPYLEA